MSIIVPVLLYVLPLFFIIGMVVFKYSFTLQQAGIFTSIFAVIPGIVTMLKRLGRFRTEGNQSILALGNCFGRHGHENIAQWFLLKHSKLESLFNASIIIIPALFLLAGLLMQLIATFSNAK